MSAPRKVNAQQAVAKRKEAEQLMAAGEKALQTGLFKWTPDYELGASSFDKAALAFQQAGLFESSVKAHKRAAFCYVQTKTEYSAAKAYEAAAKTMEGQKIYKDASLLYQKAADLYGMAGYNERRGEVYAKAAKALETGGLLSDAALMLEEAVNSYEAEDQEYQAIELYKKLNGFYIDLQRPEKALDGLARMVGVFKKLEQQHNVDSAYLHIVIVLLSTGDGQKANEKLNEFMNDSPSFMTGGDYDMASQLLDAVHSDGPEQLDTFRKKKLHNLRERTYAKLVRELKPFGSSAHPSQKLSDWDEDQLILGTPERDEPTSTGEVAEERDEPASTGEAPAPPTEAEVPAEDPPAEVEVTDDDLL